MTDVISQAIHLRKGGNYRQALALLEERPATSAALHCEKGLNLYFLGQHSSAAAYFRQALALEPSNLAALVNLGACLNDLGNHQEAISSYEKALLLDPANASAWGNLAKALHDSGEFERSIYCYHRALDTHRAPQHLRGLALAYRKSGRFDRSRELLLEALAINPNDERAHFGLAMNCFYLEEYEEGLKEFEWRAKLTKQQNFRRESPAIFSKPEYFGGSLAGKTLLLYTEQGFGDSIQFSRFIPLVREQAARIVMWCRPGLGKLFAANFPVDHVSEDMNQLPPFDTHLSLMSLPRYFDPTLQALQNFAPYIKPIEGHQTSVERVAGKINVGLVWGAEQLGYEYANKKIPLEMLTPLFDIPGIAWHSLQVGPDSEDLKEFPLAHRLQHHGNKFHDFVDTAAAVAELDLIISVDTAVAHLAGAMGKPTWVLLPKYADWRWRADGQRITWYPSTRLYRQDSHGDWSPVIYRITQDSTKSVKPRRQKSTMKTIYLHIGFHKTGTTSIQEALRLNSDYLSKKGIIYYQDPAYPNTSFGNHTLALSIRNIEHPQIKIKESQQQVWDRFLDVINKTYHQKIVVSSEVFMEGVKKEYIRERLDAFKVKIIIFLREQSAWFDSNYAEKVKHGYEQTPEKYFLEEKNQRLDYFSEIERWATLFGEDNLILEDYDRASRNKGLIPYFLNHIDLASIDQEKLAGSNLKLNTRFPSHFINLLLSHNQLGLSYNDKMALTQTLAKVLKIHPILSNLPTFKIDDELRQEIKIACRNSNVLLKQKYNIDFL
ncbi:MAG: tetratricopeptide repeat-containing glycosyltransferase family protein [Porticoccaceae bacterium]